MKTSFYFLIGIFVNCTLATGQNKEAVPVATGFALVELFTAEGCSSCPAADQLLKEMTGILEKEGKHIIPLSFHVTYWNSYGWNDPYSQEIFANRQKKYKEILQLDQLYTPQAIVNGQQAFIGSNPIAFRNVATEAANRTSGNDIHADVQFTGKQLTIKYQLNNKPAHAVLNIAIVEKEVEHFVVSGENAGKTLHHINLVRNLTTFTAQLTNSVTIDWPHDLSINNSSLILCLQNSKTMEVQAALVLEIK